MSYLKDKVSKKIDELIKENPRNELDMEYLKRNLPNRMRLTRYDVPNIMRELEIDGRFFRKDGKIRRRK